MVQKSPQLTVSIKLITETCENAFKSADRPTPTAVFHIDRHKFGGKCHRGII